MPGFIAPQLATLRTTIPVAAGWLHEVKFDGYRLQPHLNDGRVTIYTRSGLDWTKRFPTIADAIGRLPASKLILDGEVISAQPSGRSDFSALQDDLKRGRRDRLAFYAFDLLYLDGFDLRAAPLIERKRVLASFLGEADTSVIRTALAPLARKHCACEQPVRRKDTTWVEPRYEAEIAYSKITTDGMLHHPSFKGLREVARSGTSQRRPR